MPTKRLKPTLIIALDPFATAFCAEVRHRLERDFGMRGTLIQTYALVYREDRFALDLNLTELADVRFDLRAAQAERDLSMSQHAEQLFERNTDDLQPALTKILRAGRSLGDMEEAEREGVEIVDERVIYLVLSSADPIAGGVALGVARLIKWLYATRFADELHTLHALVLLPDLFENHSAPDYACTYALLKRLDVAFDKHIEITPQQFQPPFESCWLLDGRNARAIETQTLAGNIAGYADAFAGFLGAEPERSGAEIGRKARGKPPAYNSFGFGELYFPSDTAITRLSATLAAEITRSAFLAENSPTPNNARQLLVAAKQFVLSRNYDNTLQSLERHKGEAIWRQFNPSTELRETALNEYAVELSRRHEEFVQNTQLEYRNALLARNAQVREELDSLLDIEIDRLADASPIGLNDALAYLNIMVEPAIALHKHLLGEDPENLITALRSVEGGLDTRLGVVLDQQQTDELLEQVQDLRSQLDALRTDLRLLPASSAESHHRTRHPEAQSQAPQEGPSNQEDAPSGEQATTVSDAESVPPRLRLTREMEEIEQRLLSMSDRFNRAIEAEDRAADILRREAKKRVLIEKEEHIEQVEAEIMNIGGQLQEAKRALGELLEEKQQFLRHHFIIRPSLLALIVFGVPLLAAVGDLGPARDLVAFFWIHLSQFLVGMVILALVYAGVIFWKFGRDLNQRLKNGHERVKMLSSQLSAAAAQLRRAHNDQLFFQYEVTAHQMRADALTHAVETASQRIRNLTDKLKALQEIGNFFQHMQSEAEPAASVMRRPLLQAKDIDAYYRKTITDLEPLANEFRSDYVQRSQVRSISPEEFRAKLLTFTLARFSHLADLSIEDALLHQRDLVPPETARTRMRELYDASQPLLRLRQADATGTGLFAQQDATLWVCGDESARLRDLYQSICPEINVRPGDDDKALSVLTRSLKFPAYFIAAIEFYRDCYERDPNNKGAADLPDVLPTNDRINNIHKRFLLALAIGVVVRSSTGEYVLANGSGESFGVDRKQIAERLATNFASHKLFADFEAHLKERLSTDDSVYNKLTDFLTSTPDLDNLEREMLNSLTRKYF